MAKQDEAKRDDKKSAKQKVKNACYLYSKANYPIIIQYNGKDLVLPPYARNFALADESKLGALPKEVKKVAKREDK